MTILILSAIRTDTDMTSVTSSPHYRVDGASTLSWLGNIIVNTYSAAAVSSATDINATTNVITKIAHGLILGLVVRVTSSLLIPSGLSLATDYFVIPLTTDTFAIAASSAEAIAGTRKSLGSAGTGTVTFTPSAISGASAKLQFTQNDTSLTAGIWADVPNASVNITASGPQVLLWTTPISFKYIRYQYSLSAGSITAVNYLRGLMVG